MRHRTVVDGLVTVLGDLITQILALEVRCMGKHVAAGDVTHRIDAFGRCAQVVVGLDVAARVRLQVGIFDPDVIAVRHAANTEEQRFTVAAWSGCHRRGRSPCETASRRAWRMRSSS